MKGNSPATEGGSFLIGSSLRYLPHEVLCGRNILGERAAIIERTAWDEAGDAISNGESRHGFSDLHNFTSEIKSEDIARNIDPLQT